MQQPSEQAMTTAGGKSEAPEGSAQGLLDFLTWAGQKNEIVEATASALRTGCQKVLSVEDDLRGLDLRTADIDRIVDRFRVGNRLKMKPRTVAQYEQRFRQSLDMYTRFLDGDPDWKPATRSRSGTSGSRASANKSTPNRSTRSTRASSTNSAETVDHEAPLDDLIAYPFPLRPGITVKLHLPSDLTSREANRLSAFIAALSIDDPQGSPPGDNAS